jgi:hypothetical protein
VYKRQYITDYYPLNCGQTYYLIGKDGVGNQSTSYAINIACPTTTTTTTTTAAPTTTTAAPTTTTAAPTTTTAAPISCHTWSVYSAEGYAGEYAGIYWTNCSGFADNTSYYISSDNQFLMDICVRDGHIPTIYYGYAIESANTCS